MRILSLLVFLCAAEAQAAANDFYADLFAPGFKLGTRGRGEFRQYQRQGGTELRQTRFDLSVPLAQTELSTWRAQAHGDYDALDTNSVFPNLRRLPRGLWDAGVGISNTRELGEGRVLGGNVRVGSASDRPFRYGRDYGYAVDFTYKLPRANEAAWIFFLGWSNTRNFLNKIPLPGVAYFFKARENLRMVVGVPFLLAYWMPADAWTVSAFVLPIRTGEIKVAYGNPRGFQPYLLTKYGTQNFRLTERTNADEKLFFEEGVAQTGVNLPVYIRTFVDLYGGYSFERRYFLAEKATERNDAPRIRPENALFAGARLSASF